MPSFTYMGTYYQFKIFKVCNSFKQNLHAPYLQMVLVSISDLRAKRHRLRQCNLFNWSSPTFLLLNSHSNLDLVAWIPAEHKCSLLPGDMDKHRIKFDAVQPRNTLLCQEQRIETYICSSSREKPALISSKVKFPRRKLPHWKHISLCSLYSRTPRQPNELL
jgi:hypothetical protein